MSEEKKKLNSLIGFLTANKVDNYNGWEWGGEKKEEQIQNNLQDKSKKQEWQIFFWVTAAKSPFPCWESQSTLTT